MGKNRQVIKLFVVLFFSSVFIFSFSHFGAKAFETITNTNGKYSEGTTVGSVDVSGKSNSEAIILLEEKYIEWVQNVKIELQYSEKVIPFNVNQFHFDAAQTVKSIQNGQKNPATITIELLEVEEQIQMLFPELSLKELELTKLTTDLTNTASQFENGPFIFNLTSDYMLAVAGNRDAVISEVIVSLPEIPSDLATVLENNPEIKIAEEATFSLVEFAKQQKLETSSSLSVIATGIYQAILPTNFTIAERNISNALPNYAVLGYEARINVEKGADLVIVNPNKASYTLEFKVENKNLKVTLKGEKFLYNYEVNKKDEQLLQPKTIIQYSPLLLPGKTNVQNNGAEGKIVKVYRDIYQGSQLIESQLIAEDYYPPVYRIEIHGLAGTQNVETQTITKPNTNETASSTGNQVPVTSDTTQPNSDDDLFGKPNEQPK
ncbi:G5 domain-containing protein [Neobacillus niacini]|uniref:G5 domain-containing protein n=1 Tax=Neobacillus niacini TaxID=86668 RepID=UPI0030030A09